MEEKSIKKRIEEKKDEEEERRDAEERALAGLAVMLSGKFTDEQEEEARRRFQPSFGAAFRKERESLKQK